MAKRKGYKKRSYSRRRKVSGVGNVKVGESIMEIGMVLLGVAAGGVLKRTVLSNKSTMVQALVPLAGGIALPMVLKSNVGKMIGIGLAASGGQMLLAKMNIGALGNDTLDVPISISGDGLSLLAGANDNDLVLAGDDLNDDSMAGDNMPLNLLAGIFD